VATGNSLGYNDIRVNDCSDQWTTVYLFSILNPDHSLIDNENERLNDKKDMI